MADGTDETEIVELREEAARLRDEVAQARRDAEEAARTVAAATAEAEGLRAEVSAAQDAARAQEAEAASLRERLAGAEARASTAAARYRDVLMAQEPALPAELVGGDTVDAIDASLAAARELTARIRAHMEAEAQARQVPAGAPPRGAPDLAALSPEEKIRYGLSRREG